MAEYLFRYRELPQDDGETNTAHLSATKRAHLTDVFAADVRMSFPPASVVVHEGSKDGDRTLSVATDVLSEATVCSIVAASMKRHQLIGI